MLWQYAIRRFALGALVMIVAASTALGTGPEVSAANKDGAIKRKDFPSKEAFKLECELLGGTFSEDGLGNTNCHFPGGDWIQCDANGKDCWYTPAPKPVAGIRIPGVQVPYAEGSVVAAPRSPAVDSSPPAADEQPVVAPDDREPAKEKAKKKSKKNKDKKSKKGKKKGKGRNRR